MITNSQPLLPIVRMEEYPFPLFKMDYTPKYPKKDLISRLKLNTTYHRWEDMRVEKPGIQSEMRIVCKEITDIIDTGREMVKQVQDSWKLPSDVTIESHWIYMSGPDNPWAPWHKHHHVGGVDWIVPQWTYVFYVELSTNHKSPENVLRQN